MALWRSRRWQPQLPFFLLIPLALFIWLVLMRQFRLDDAFITYRYARNVAAGHGLVYNPGEMVLSTTAPLYALLLAALSLIVPDFHLLGGLTGALCIGLGGVVIVHLLPDRVAYRFRLLAGMLYTLAIPLWLALGMETSLWILLVLVAVWLAESERQTLAGLSVGLAMLARPDAALPGGLIGLWLLVKAVKALRVKGGDSSPDNGRPPVSPTIKPVVGYALAAALPVLLFYGWAWLTYGSLFPATLAAKRAQAAMGITGLGIDVTTIEGLRLIGASLLEQNPLYLFIGILAILGLFTLGTGGSPAVILIVVWGVLHVAVYAVLHVAPYRWYYAPLVPGLIMLAALGLNWLINLMPVEPTHQAKRVMGILLAVLLLLMPLSSFIVVSDYFQKGGPSGPMVPVVDWQTYRETGEWIAANTPANALIGVAEVGQLGFYAQRTMTDNPGLLQPVVAENLMRRDVYSWLPAFAPDYLVFQRFGDHALVIFNFRIDDNPWFVKSYQWINTFDDPRYAYGPVEIYERVAEHRPMVEYPAALDFGPLQLVGWATDAIDLSEEAPDGTPVRIRLDWQVMDPEGLPEEVHIAMILLDAGEKTNTDMNYNTANWADFTDQPFSTWHTMVLDENLPAGGYLLAVSANAADTEEEDAYQAQGLGWFDVSFPKGPISNEGPLFGDGTQGLIRLAESSIQMDAAELTLHLTWQAAANVPTDYAFFAHLIPAGEEQPATQFAGQPRDERYPTHIWQAGEIVPDTVTVPLPEEPGTYRLAVGWFVAHTGQRMTLEDGTELLFLDEITVD